MSAAAPTAAPPAPLAAPTGSVAAPQTWDQLWTQAQQQAGTEVGAQTAPLQASSTSLQGQEAGAEGQISNEFGQILPYVGASAQREEAFNNQSLQMEQGIFQAAGQRMNDLAQNRAAEAQQLAQKMGGPVATGEFLQGIAPYENAFPSMAAGEMLHSLGLSTAHAGEAEAFAGKVFPALETEEQAKSRSFFENQIKQNQDQINTLNASKSGLANDKLTSLVQNERQYELDLKNAALDRLKSNRDWQATQHQLKNDDARLALETAGTTGTYKGKPTLENIKLTVSQQQAAERLGISEARLKQTIAKSTESSQIQQERLSAQVSKNGMSVIDAAMNPNKGRPITMTTKVNIPPGSLAELRAESGKMSDAHYDPKTKSWYQYQRLTLSPQDWAKRGGYSGTTPVSDPQQLFDLVRGSVPLLSPKAVVNLVRAKTGLKNWSPGQPSTYSGNDLGKMSQNQLKGIAEGRGWKPGMGGTKQNLMDFILHHNPAPAGG